MATHRYKPTRPHRHHKTNKPRVVIYVDDETYAEMDAYAKERDCSFSEASRILIDVGIETLKLEGEANEDCITTR